MNWALNEGFDRKEKKHCNQREWLGAKVWNWRTGAGLVTSLLWM